MGMFAEDIFFGNNSLQIFTKPLSSISIDSFQVKQESCFRLSPNSVILHREKGRHAYEVQTW